jgi:hypothetical protein
MVRTAASVVGAALALLLGATACGSDDKKDSEPELIGASKLCDGTLSAAAQASLEDVTGQKQFGPSTVGDLYGDGLQGLAKKIKLQFTDQDFTTETLCSIYLPVGNLPDLTLEFQAEEKGTGGELGKYFSKRYRMGTESMAGDRHGSIDFKCLSPELESTEDAPIYVGGEVRKDRPPHTTAAKAADDNMTIIHSAALALAKQLGCENNGGLPATPDLTFTTK